MKKLPFFLFPGLACTNKIFGPQCEELADLCTVIVPEWIEPKCGESLEEFAQRWGENVWETWFSENAVPEKRLETQAGCLVGGLSFGGMVAPFVGDVLQKHGVTVRTGVRISTVRFGNQIPENFCFLWNLFCFLPFGGWLFLKLLCAVLLKIYGSRLSSARRETFLQILESPPRRSQRVLKMIATWRETERLHAFPIIQIHGRWDRLLPLRLVESPEVLILEAGHEMTLTQPQKVNPLLRKIIEQYSD